MPARFRARAADKLNYRYPGVGGQSYFDLVNNVREVLLSVEASRRDTIIVCDVAVARVRLRSERLRAGPGPSHALSARPTPRGSSLWLLAVAARGAGPPWLL